MANEPRLRKLRSDFTHILAGRSLRAERVLDGNEQNASVDIVVVAVLGLRIRRQAAAGKRRGGGIHDEVSAGLDRSEREPAEYVFG